MVNLHTGCYMLGAWGLTEKAPEEFNQYLIDEYRTNMEHTMELRE
jgi:hypothetical protein